MPKEKNKSVLIVLSESDPLLARVYKLKFKNDEGWDVKIVSTYEEALKNILNEDKPHIVVTSIILQGEKTGFDLIKSITSNSDISVSSIPVLVLSSLGQDSDKDKALEAGASAYYIKSEISVKDFIDKIKEFLD